MRLVNLHDLNKTIVGFIISMLKTSGYEIEANIF